jgi:hypothetical protein
MMYLASYRCPPHRPQPGQWLDWLLRWAFHVLVCVGTLSRFSHTELVFGEPDENGESLCATSSGRDGGVRFKRIKLDPARWTVDPLSGLHANAEAQALLWFHKHEGEPYDHQGLAAVWLFTVAPFMRAVWRLIQARRRWFCSESAAAALGLWRPWTRSPGALRRWAVKQLPKA